MIIHNWKQICHVFFDRIYCEHTYEKKIAPVVLQQFLPCILQLQYGMCPKNHDSFNLREMSDLKDRTS